MQAKEYYTGDEAIATPELFCASYPIEYDIITVWGDMDRWLLFLLTVDGNSGEPGPF